MASRPLSSFCCSFSIAVKAIRGRFSDLVCTDPTRRSASEPYHFGLQAVRASSFELSVLSSIGIYSSGHLAHRPWLGESLPENIQGGKARHEGQESEHRYVVVNSVQARRNSCSITENWEQNNGEWNEKGRRDENEI